MNLLELRRVRVGYHRQPLLPAVDLSLAPGVFMGVVGPNGSGKTTLVKTMLTLLPPVEGQVAFPGGRDPRHVKCGEIMSKPAISCKPGDDISRAEELMSKHHISRMCVSDGDILKGVISLSDIVQAERTRGAETLRKVSEREAPAAH